MRPSDGGDPVPVAGLWIVLHRVGSDRAAPVDSVRSARTGAFRFRYTPFGSPDALYFVSARYGGIAYFSPPLRADTIRGEDADIIVYDTTTDSAAIRVQGRHFVVSAPRGTTREVAEVFELENGGTRTVVARDSVTPLWSVALPRQADSASVAPGDVTAAAVAFRNGRAEVYAPVSPGVRQLVITYRLPADAMPLAVPVEHAVSVLEVLLEEPRASAEGARLAEVEPGVIDGRQFRRYLAQDVPPPAVMRISAPMPVEHNQSATKVLAGVIASAMLVGLGAWLVKRRGTSDVRTTTYGVDGGTSNVRRQTSDVERLVAELATLDLRFEKSSGTPEERTAYERSRAELKARIARMLAEEQAPV
jgi:hypothetical protein